MTALAAGALATIALVVAAVPRRPAAHPRPLQAPRSGSPRRGALSRLGAWMRRVGSLAGSPLPDVALGIAAVSAPMALAVTPILAAAICAAVWFHAWLAGRRAVAAQHRHLALVLPDCVDLFLLCAGAGLALPLAHPLVASRAPAPLGPALLDADSAAAQGRPRAEALIDALAPLGDRASALAHVLAEHLRYGVPHAPAMERVSLELRLDRRRRAEEDARKVPVRLLAPLVTCILPAFALLTVVPLLAASLEALPR
jgi:tight adherence protein C